MPSPVREALPAELLGSPVTHGEHHALLVLTLMCDVDVVGGLDRLDDAFVLSPLPERDEVPMRAVEVSALSDPSESMLEDEDYSACTTDSGASLGMLCCAMLCCAVLCCAVM